MCQNYHASEGDKYSLFDRLSAYVSKFDKDWIRRIEPASEKSIEQLKKISNYDKWVKLFPKDYEIFLQKMGNCDGGLLSKPLLGHCDVNSIIEIYEGYREEVDEDIRELNDQPYLVIFNQEMGMDYAIELLPSQKFGRVVNFEYANSAVIISDSFEKLLFQCAFSNFVKYKHRFFLGSTDTDVAAILLKTGEAHLFAVIDKIVQEFSMEKIWFSDSVHYIASNNSVCFTMNSVHTKKDSYAISGFITGDDLKIVKALSNAFVYNAGLSVSPNLSY